MRIFISNSQNAGSVTSKKRNKKQQQQRMIHRKKKEELHIVFIYIKTFYELNVLSLSCCRYCIWCFRYFAENSINGKGVIKIVKNFLQATQQTIPKEAAMWSSSKYEIIMSHITSISLLFHSSHTYSFNFCLHVSHHAYDLI